MYVLMLGGVAYDSWKGGRLFTLVDCFREARGVGQCTIMTTTGRVVLRNAGSMFVRANLRASIKAQKYFV